MVDITDYAATGRHPNRPSTTWHDHDLSAVPECAAHHTYAQTVPVDRFEIWVCPQCGTYSDTYQSYTNGSHLIEPTHVDPERVIVITGRELIPPPSGSSDAFGDGTMDAAIVVSPYDAKADLNAFKADAEWPHPPRRFRRWVPERNVWAVAYREKPAFIDHMAARDWIVVDPFGLAHGD